MDYASILRVLVDLQGVPKAAAELAALDATQKKVGGSATSMGRDLDTATAKARGMQADVAKATAVTGALGDGLGKTGKNATAAGDGFEHAGGAAAGFGRDLERAHAVTSDASSALGGLLGDTDDYSAALMRAHGIQQQAVSASEQLRQAREALAGQVGGLLGDETDLASVMQRSSQAHTDAARSAEDLDVATRQLPQSITAVNSGFSEASLTVARAREELDRTGTVSRSMMGELNALGSRGVQGLDRDLTKASDTIRKAERELADTGTISRRTARDLEALGAGGDGAGNGIRGLLAAVGGAPGGISMLGAAAIAVVPVLVALVGAAIALAAALAPLAGLAGAAAAGIAAGATAFGVFKLASMGVTDALKEQTTNQAQAAEAAVTAASQHRAAAAQITAAMDGVRSAHEQVRNATERLDQAEQQAQAAQQGVTRARTEAARALVDMGSSLEEARISEQQATFAVQDAADALHRLIAGASQQQLVEGAQRATDALHSQQAAVLALTDAQDAYNALINGPDAQTIAEAQQAVTNAQHDQESAAVSLTKAQQKYDAVMADASATDLAKADALAQLHQAQDGVANSANRTIDAQAQLTKLQTPASDHEKAKALLAVQQAQDAVNDATNAQVDAQTDLDKLKAPASQQDIAKALLAVQAAELHLTEAKRARVRQEKDTAAAVKAGIDGSPQMVAAQRAVAQANRQVIDAQRALGDAHRSVTRAEQQLHDAQLNAADSATRAADAAGKLNQKLDALPAGAQQFVHYLVGLKPKLDELRETAASGLFPGVQAGITAAMGSFGAVNGVVGETAHAMGDVATQAGELVGSKGFGKDIETVGKTNASVLRTLGDGAVHVVSALRHVIVAAGPLTTWLAKVADGWARNADKAAETGRENGKLAGFFDQTRSVLVRLGSILEHTVGGLLGMGHAAKGSGQDMLKSIDAAAKRFDGWTHSIDGQKSLTQFFERSKELLGNLIPVLTGVGKATAGIGFGPMNTALKLAGPYAQELTYAFLGYKLAVTGAEVATKGMAAAEWLLNAAMDANPIVLVGLAIVALVAGMVVAYEKVGWFHDAINGAWNAIKTGVSAVVGFVKDHWPLLIGALLGPVGIVVAEVATHWDKFKHLASDAVTAVVEFFKGLPSRILDGIKTGASAIADAAGWIKDQLVKLVKDEIAGFKVIGGWVLDRIVDGFKAVTDLLGTVGSWVKDRIVDLVKAEIEGWKAIGTWVLDRLVDGFKTVTDLLGSIGSWIKDKIQGFIHDEAEGWKAVGSWVLNKIVDGFKIVTDALSGAGSWLFGKVKGVVHDTADDLKSLGGWVLDRIVDGLTFVSDKGISGVSGVGDWLLKQVRSAVHAIKDGLGELGGWIVDRIVDGLKAGANVFIGFLNAIIGAIDLIPGVHIDKIKKLAQGGTTATAASDHVAAFASGGEIAKGTLITKPIIMMGEEAPQHPEWVIPTNPAYRQRALMLHQAAGKALGLAQGGVFSSTAYGPPWTGINGTGVTATGVDLRPARPYFGVAVDPNVIPLGSMLDIQPNPFNFAGSFQAFDTGSAIKGNRIDFYDWYGRQDQLDWGRRNVQVSIVGAGSGGGGLGDVLSKGASFILDMLPGVGDLPDWLKDTGHYVLHHVIDWIKDKVADLVGSAVHGDDRATGPAGGGGLGTFDGRPVANWIVPVLEWARSHGWAGHITSGYRDRQHNAEIGGAPSSNHMTTAYPGGAIDVGGWGARAAGQALYEVLLNYPGPRRLIWGGPVIGDWGHFSATGHAIGGILGKTGGMYGGLPFGGSFADGGIVPGPLGAPTMILAHGGETVTPAGGSGLEATIRALGDEIRGLKDSLGVRVYLGEEDITDRVEVVMDRRDRASAQQFRAGVGR